jgi:diguanylate cyclase (GGDEF)-like protein
VRRLCVVETRPECPIRPKADLRLELLLSETPGAPDTPPSEPAAADSTRPLGTRSAPLEELRERLLAQSPSGDPRRVNQLTGMLGIDAYLAGCAERLEQERAAPRMGLTAVRIDLNKFKLVNAIGTHAFGNRVLLAVAEAIEAVLPRGSVAGNPGGDEFTLLLPTSDPRQAAYWVNEIRDEAFKRVVDNLVRTPRTSEDFEILERLGLITEQERAQYKGRPNLVFEVDEQRVRSVVAGIFGIADGKEVVDVDGPLEAMEEVMRADLAADATAYVAKDLLEFGRVAAEFRRFRFEALNWGYPPGYKPSATEVVAYFHQLTMTPPASAEQPANAEQESERPADTAVEADPVVEADPPADPAAELLEAINKLNIVQATTGQYLQLKKTVTREAVRRAEPWVWEIVDPTTVDPDDLPAAVEDALADVLLARVYLGIHDPQYMIGEGVDRRVGPSKAPLRPGLTRMAERAQAVAGNPGATVVSPAGVQPEPTPDEAVALWRQGLTIVAQAPSSAEGQSNAESPRAETYSERVLRVNAAYWAVEGPQQEKVHLIPQSAVSRIAVSRAEREARVAALVAQRKAIASGTASTPETPSAPSTPGAPSSPQAPSTAGTTSTPAPTPQAPPASGPDNPSPAPEPGEPPAPQASNRPSSPGDPSGPAPSAPQAQPPTPTGPEGGPPQAHGASHRPLERPVAPPDDPQRPPAVEPLRPPNRGVTERVEGTPRTPVRGTRLGRNRGGVAGPAAPGERPAPPAEAAAPRAPGRPSLGLNQPEENRLPGRTSNPAGDQAAAPLDSPGGLERPFGKRPGDGLRPPT